MEKWNNDLLKEIEAIASAAELHTAGTPPKTKKVCLRSPGAGGSFLTTPRPNGVAVLPDDVRFRGGS